VPILARLELSGEAGHVRVQIGIDNQAEDHRLQVLLPLGAPVSHGVYAGHFETVHRPTSVDPGGEDWIEQPQPQQPMRGLILVGDGQRGLGVAARGLYEGSVSADGVIAVTLLRAFGWLSRDDLSSRRGGAGPQLPTPGGQCLGQREFELLLFPWDGDEHAGTQTAEAFQTGLRAAGTSLHGGTLPHQGAFLSIEGQGFCLTAVKTAEDGDGLIVRGYNTGAEPTQITIAGIRPIQRAILSRLDEAPLGPLHLDSQGRASLQAGPHAIVTARLTF
jgi:mannosylglycerate hydrolase